jgi:uncharacterized Rmd1/YagE family protein
MLGERIKLRGLPRVTTGAGPVALETSAQAAFAFRWGALVHIGADAAEVERLRSLLAPRVREPVTEPAEERCFVVGDAEKDEVTEAGLVRLCELSAPRLQLVATALAKSAALTHQEQDLARTLDRTEPVVARLRRTGRLRIHSPGLMRAVGEALSARSRAATRVEPGDKPDLLWDHPELERMYLRLVEEFELRDRAAALDAKLALIGEALQTMVSLIEARRSLGLEIAVTLLIAVEVAATLYGLLKPG